MPLERVPLRLRSERVSALLGCNLVGTEHERRLRSTRVRQRLEREPGIEGSAELIPESLPVERGERAVFRPDRPDVLA
jgi:hypothetical protein